MKRWTSSSSGFSTRSGKRSVASSAESAPSAARRRRVSPPARAALASPLLTLFVTACGIPPAEHAAVHRDLERSKAEAAQIALRCEDGDAAARRHLESCDRARTGAEARVKLLERDLLSTKEQKGELAGDLRVLEEHVRQLQAERQAIVERRRRRLTISERFAALAEAAPELAGLSPGVEAGRLTLTLPSAPTPEALDRIAEVLRALPDERWRVEATDAEWDAAAAAAASVASLLTDRGVPAGGLMASAARGGKDEGPGLRLILAPDLSAVPGFEAGPSPPAAAERE